MWWHQLEKAGIELGRGTQIIYVPLHAEGDITHKDCEMGFVTSVRGDAAFCRYWSKRDSDELRTKANSELTSKSDLYVLNTVPRESVEEALEKYCQEVT